MVAVCGFRGVVLAIMIGLSMLVSAHLALTADSVSSSAVRVGTPYPLHVPFGLEELESYIPPDNPLRVEKVELGSLLFFDPRPSANNTVSCASCHPAAGVDRRATGLDRDSSLEEVIEFYDKGGIQNPHLSNLMIPLNLTAQEKADLVEYMRSLNGEGWEVTPPVAFPQ
jgi:hypothetical protein